MAGKRDQSIGDLGEFGFIRAIQEDCLLSPESVIAGIGDDCAVIGPYDGRVLLITTDLLLEDIHFTFKNSSPEQVGEKAAAVNLSDIAAMGGTARHLFLSLAAPPSAATDMLFGLYAGIKEQCRRHGVNILGGDTSAAFERLMISITAVGEAAEAEVLYRHGGGPGDRIYVTGTLGDSSAGLKLITGEVSAPQGVAALLKKAHTLPSPFLKTGRRIGRSRLASAMIDVSDGLLSDLGHICEASGVGAGLWRWAIPQSKEVKRLAEINGLEPLDLALRGGEDYRLLVTVPEENAASFEGMFQEADACPIYGIGVLTKEKGIRLMDRDGTAEAVEATGFDHFKAV